MELHFPHLWQITQILNHTFNFSPWLDVLKTLQQAILDLRVFSLQHPRLVFLNIFIMEFFHFQRIKQIWKNF